MFYSHFGSRLFFFLPGLELIFNGSCWVPWESVKMVISAGLIFAVILILAEPGW